jgi:hypothetical protein
VNDDGVLDILATRHRNRKENFALAQLCELLGIAPSKSNPESAVEADKKGSIFKRSESDSKLLPNISLHQALMRAKNVAKNTIDDDEKLPSPSRPIFLMQCSNFA